jgi:hypothetical protein
MGMEKITMKDNIDIQMGLILKDDGRHKAVQSIIVIH